MRPDTEIYTKYVFGYRQLFVREYDDVANITHERQITWSQQGDMAPGDLLGDRLIMLDGPDAEYPEGVGGWRSRVDPTDELAIILILSSVNPMVPALRPMRPERGTAACSRSLRRCRASA